MIPGFHLDTDGLSARVALEQPEGFEREHKGSAARMANTGEFSYTDSINSAVLTCA